MLALIIDDSRAMRTLIGQALRSLGFQILEACNGSEGLTRLREAGGVDVTFVDWNMPVMNGIEFVRSVRRIPQYDAMPLMMVTTENDIGKIIMALEGGANEYVMKPFTPGVIAHKLELMGLPLGRR